MGTIVVRTHSGCHCYKRDLGLLALPNEGVPVAKLSSRYPSFAICRQHNIQYGGISEGGQKPFQAVGLIESLFEP